MNKIEDKIVLGFIGYKDAGKTTVKETLASLHLGRVMGFGHSDPIYQICFEMGVPIEYILKKELRDEQIPGFNEGMTARKLMQSVGDYGKSVGGQEIWIDIAHKKMRHSIDEFDFAVFDNVRYPNEADKIVEAGGFLIFIKNDNAINDDTHSSERNIDALARVSDYVLDNTPLPDGTYDNDRLQLELKGIINDIQARKGFFV